MWVVGVVGAVGFGGFGGGGGLGGLVGLSLGVVSGALSQAVSGCFPPIFRTGLCPFIQLSVLDQKGFKKHKNWKTAQNQTSPKTTHHMTAILMGEQQFFNIAECKRAEKPKIA